jgi:hypothetical protein
MNNEAMKKFKIHSVDSGLCRINYSTRNASNERLIYCIQQDTHDSCKLFRSSRDGEPSYPVQFSHGIEFELPSGDSTIERLAREFILKNYSGGKS